MKYQNNNMSISISIDTTFNQSALMNKCLFHWNPNSIYRDLLLIAGNTEPSVDECMSSMGFLILSVTSVVLFLLLITVFVIFCVRMIHKSSKTSTDSSKSFDNASYMS